MIGVLIGKGNTADVFDMGNNKVIKLFNTGYPLNSMRNEFEKSKLLNVLDTPIAKSYELVTYGGRYGIIYDRIDGESMLDILLHTQDLEKYATNALRKLREREFNTGRYNPVVMFPEFPITEDTESPGKRHETIEAVLEDSMEDGTRSILDLNSVSTNNDYCIARLLSENEMIEFFGSKTPTMKDYL